MSKDWSDYEMQEFATAVIKHVKDVLNPQIIEKDICFPDSEMIHEIITSELETYRANNEV